MNYYPIKENFENVFNQHEEVIENLIKNHSPQIEAICEKIDDADFYRRCISFYESSNYEFKDKMIVYTHPITKEKSFCILNEYFISISNLKGFDQFLFRYYKTYFVLNDNSCCGKWCSYSNTY